MRGRTSRATVAPVGVGSGKPYFQWAPGWAKAYTIGPRGRVGGNSDKGG
jgi:hypothetical protein